MFYFTESASLDSVFQLGTVPCSDRTLRVKDVLLSRWIVHVPLCFAPM